MTEISISANDLDLTCMLGTLDPDAMGIASPGTYNVARAHFGGRHLPVNPALVALLQGMHDKVFRPSTSC